MGSRSEPVVAPPNADHVIAMCNGGVKSVVCNGTATVVKATVAKDATGPTEPVSFGFTEEPPALPSPVQNDDDVGSPLASLFLPPRLIITDVDGVDFDQWDDFVDSPASNHVTAQSGLPSVIDASAATAAGTNIYYPAE